MDWLGEGGYSLSFTPAAQVLRRYTDGGTVRQAPFVLAGREPYGPEAGLNLGTSGFYEQLAAWMERQTAKGQLPVLPGQARALGLEALSSGYLSEENGENARYQIQCRLTYQCPALET